MEHFSTLTPISAGPQSRQPNTSTLIARLGHWAAGLPLSEPIPINDSEVTALASWVRSMSLRPDSQDVVERLIRSRGAIFRGHPVVVLGVPR